MFKIKRNGINDTVTQTGNKSHGDRLTSVLLSCFILCKIKYNEKSIKWI